MKEVIQIATQLVRGRIVSGTLPDVDRQALLDALEHGHDDCVPRDHVNMQIFDATEQYRLDAEQQYDRAEQAERERDAAQTAARTERDREAVLIASLLREDLVKSPKDRREGVKYWEGFNDALRQWAEIIENSVEERWAGECMCEQYLSTNPGCQIHGPAADRDPDPFICQRCNVPVAYIGHFGDNVTHVAPGLDPNQIRVALDANADHDPLPETYLSAADE